MDRHQLVVEQLVKVTHDEWVRALKEVHKYIDKRIAERTIFGAHSSTELGETPRNHYVTEAIVKLYDGSWDWKFETRTIAEQLEIIVGSMIGERVRKYLTAANMVKIKGVDPSKLSNMNKPEIEEEDESKVVQFLECIEAAIGDNQDLKDLYDLKKDGYSMEEMVEYFGSKDKVYKLSERLYAKARIEAKKRKLQLY